jgi:hypothetical protein
VTQIPGSPEPEPTQASAAEPAAQQPAAASQDATPETVASNAWGRVDATGEVFVRTSEGERSVGSWQVGEPERALAFFGRKFDELALQVDLLEQRLNTTDLSAAQAEASIQRLRARGRITLTKSSPRGSGPSRTPERWRCST